MGCPGIERGASSAAAGGGTVSLACGGAGLGTCWGEEQALAMLSEAGFEEVEVKTLDHDFQNNFYVARLG
jgi:hypothetical protein